MSSSEATRAEHAWRLPVLLGGLTVLLGSFHLTVPSLWADEVATRNAVTRSLPQLLSMLGQIDATHTVWYLLTWGWVQLFGTSVLALRMLPLLFAGVTVALFTALATQLLGRRGGLFSALSLLWIPALLSAATQARSYTLTVAMTIAAMLLLHQALIRGGAWRWIWYAAVTALGIVVFSLTALMLLVHGLIVAGYRAEPRRRVLLHWGIAACGALGVTAPFLLWSMHIGSAAVQLDWLRNPSPRALLRSILLTQWFGTPTGTVAVRATELLAALCWLAIAICLLHPRSAPLLWKRVGGNIPPIWIGILWMSVPTAALLLMSYTLTPLYANRYLLYTTPGMALLLGGALAGLRPQWKRITVGVLLCALCFPGLLASRFPYAHDGTDWKTAAEIVKARAASGDVILFFPDVGNTADPRRALDGYPSLLGDLDDVGLSRTAQQRNALEGTGVSPKYWKQRIPAGARVWLLARRTTTRAEYRQITRQGFRLQKIWAGPTTVVYRVRLTGHTS